MKQRFHTAVEQQCPQCGKSFFAWESHLRRGWAKHCSRACFYASRAVPLANRFWSLVKRSGNDDCWHWLGSLDGEGYGTFSLRKGESGSRYAHRMSWFLAHGPIKGRLLVRHRCHVTDCVNPKHLRLGTHTDNLLDRYAHGRSSDRPEPRKQPKPPRIARQCLTCGKEFLAQSAIVANGGALYCSRPCIRRPLVDRFWEKIRKTDSCWLWTGATTAKGYGVIGLSQQEGQTTAHRASWIIHFGSIPAGQNVCHNCPDGDDPLCVNPAHLFLGTQAANLADMRRKGRQGKTGAPGSKNGNAKLTEEDIPEIRRRYDAGERPAAIAADYRVVPSLVSMIGTRTAWKHIK